MLGCTAILVLLVTLAVGGRLVQGEGTLLSSLPRDCYIVTNETNDDYIVALTNAGDVQCQQNYVLNQNGDCVKVVLRSKTRVSPKKKRPQGVPNW